MGVELAASSENLGLEDDGANKQKTTNYRATVRNDLQIRTSAVDSKTLELTLSISVITDCCDLGVSQEAGVLANLGVYMDFAEIMRAPF